VNPDHIEHRSLRTLEWERLKAYLAHEAETRAGKEACLATEPECARLLIEQLLEQTDEAMSLLEAHTAFSAQGLPDLEEALNRLQAGAALSAHELLAVRKSLIISKQTKASLALLPENSFVQLPLFIARLHVLDKLVADIDNAIDDAANVKDEASPHLRSLRKEVHRLDGSIKDELMRIIHSSTLSKALQEPIYTQRGGRYVLPVNANMRSTINGIVHDSSASGLTVYIEPMAVVELANRLRMKEAEIEHEIARILEQLSAVAHADETQITSSYNALVELDTIMARARLALKYRGCKPRLSDDGSFDFKEARHPLLVLQSPASRVVANDIALGGAERTLVITGPNTGGKTVLLKTIGLLSLMVRAGLLLPVKKDSSAAFFTQIWADIGDEQSLEQSLSTFSSHMTNIVEVVRNAGKGTLVLLDEVGAGTDPKEGAALARAVLEHLNASGAITVSTTHYGELKTLAYTEPGFVNGSLDFDEATLSPTYRLRLGVPGSSKATTISKRLGLLQSVVERALELIGESGKDLQQTIEQLEKKLVEAEARERQAKESLERVDQMKVSLDDQLNALASESERQRLSYARDMEEEFKLSKDYVRHLIADLQKQPSLPRAQKVQQDLEKVRKELGWMDEPAKSATSARDKAAQFAPGQYVRVVSLNQRGVIEDIPEPAKGKERLIVVRAGNLKMKVPVSDLELSEGSSGQKKQKQLSRERRAALPAKINQSNSIQVFVRTMSNTLDLRGQRVEQALSNLDRFVDEHVLSGIGPLMVIHGHGTGAVRQAVRDYLKDNSYIQRFRPGETHEGGDGVTIIDL